MSKLPSLFPSFLNFCRITKDVYSLGVIMMEDNAFSIDQF